MDGNARKWVLGLAPHANANATDAPEAGSASDADFSGRRRLLAGQPEQPGLSLDLEDVQDGGFRGLGERDPPTKAVRNWDDPSCTDPQRCRCVCWVREASGGQLAPICRMDGLA